MKLLRLLKSKFWYQTFLLITIGAASMSLGYAQTITVKGKVQNSANEPLQGASVLVKGTANGSYTDTNGNFTIAAAADATLIISYLGYVSQEILVNGSTNINVSLEEDITNLEEVVIVGYSTQRKSDLTGAVAQIDSKDIEKYTYPDASQALQGRMAGVSVQAQGGAPGANAFIAIRGIGTLSDAGPLFVIDGMLTGNMSTLNPSDIESVSILKDASASAIYGSRAANGVVIITTKKALEES